MTNRVMVIATERAQTQLQHPTNLKMELATMTDTVLDFQDIINRCFAAWNAPAAEQAGAVSGVFSSDAYYCDRSAEATGRDAIAELMGGLMTQFPGARFELTSPVDSHHQQARFAWRMRGEDGTTVIDGIDAVRVTDSGEVSEVLGFRER